jgi:hypothetical protein
MGVLQEIKWPLGISLGAVAAGFYWRPGRDRLSLGAILVGFGLYLDAAVLDLRRMAFETACVGLLAVAVILLLSPRSSRRQPSN